MNRRVSTARARAQFRAFQKKIPRYASNLALKHFKDSFRDGGFYDGYFKAWVPRKKADKNKRYRALLVKSGALRRSLEIKEANFKQIRIGSYTTKYATVHNQGTNRIPKRQFIGKSKLLTRKIKKKIRQEIKKLFR